MTQTICNKKINTAVISLICSISGKKGSQMFADETDDADYTGIKTSFYQLVLFNQG